MTPAAALRPSSAFRSLLLVALVLLAAACARAPSTHSGPIHGDNDPHPGVAKARSMPIQGIDISRYQGDIDFAAARAAGMRFVFIKATEGKDYLDPMFRENWRKAKLAGLPRGAYHFMTWCSTAAEQAAWFIKNVPADADALPPVLDVEWNNHSKCTNRFGREDVLEKVRVMVAAMWRHTGKLPIIYTDINFHNDTFVNEYLDNTFWIRSVAAEPHMRYDNRPWTFWQWTQTGTVRGIKGEVDRNAYFGSEMDWMTFVATGCDPRAYPVLGPAGKCQ